MNIKVITLLCGLVLSASIVAAGDGPSGDHARRYTVTVKPRPPTIKPTPACMLMCQEHRHLQIKYGTCQKYCDYCKTVEHSMEDDCWYWSP
ncbi:unnamed protein product [Tilletia controversa]|uniref:PSI domain-containing protein n=4 Tax=Tilletia TaxID=13289 RepID=A0A8X7SSH1_9BASI|nr:hypothetical protein CF336_g8926 [Tilletia laevis]KAE8182005.1 hypothetical protein CF328_g8659 [Tilletia controversa]KAE8239999.1 hypothetical protein A4X03_0g8623 [Tilletia caries]KAE8182373.1 hypothetical protein CF335_g8645 [Tilletia laevis]KAE8237583.1 hypothetical protein A4X06_0g9182 [Tilletia controversa]